MSSTNKEFISEAEDLLNESRECLLEIQDGFPEQYNPDTLNALFRSMHTLKGISGLYGHEGLKDLSHELEGLLDELRLGRIDLSEDLINFLFHNIDIVRNMVSVASEEKDTDVSSCIREIERFKNTAGMSSGEAPLSEIVGEEILRVLSEYEEHRLRTNVKDKKGIFLIYTVFSLSEFDKGLSKLTGTLKKDGELISTLPTSEGIPEGSIGFKLLFASEKDLHYLRDKTGLVIEEIYSCKPSTVQPVTQEETLRSVSSTVRVDIEKLDRILNTIGKLNLTKGAISRVEEELIETYGHSHLVFDMHRVIQNFDRRLKELQDDVLQIRMVPVGQIFSRLGQIIRRYSKGLKKTVELKTFGEDTEIDKFIAEEIADPLMHIVRNALDHGIETPEERASKGKPQTAQIKLSAFPKGNHVIVEVEDDGRGIDPSRIKEKADALGLVSRQDELDKSEIINFIFLPGFTTSETITDVSGRGVGMDVVKEKISSIGGFVDVSSEMDVFTRFSLTIPITLAIIKSLLIRSGSHNFALPLTSISETLLVKRTDIQSIEGNMIYNLRGELLPTISLAGLFDLRTADSEEKYIVVAGYGERRVGIIVDALIGSQDMVIKSLGDYFRNFKGFTGAAEVGKNEVILVIDVEAIMEETLKRYRGLAHV
ncbi:chemotaxis protein CheA [bacterium BMS3Bbin06]|nr:chemotaxis protein CheA [bacterium BMS3Abin08]GBE35030.1 chemotaxis protein CheA [bacterium BMS3Bbin06]HDO36445.1 chemotaxis protein CheA [Nitrospirota bacterium]HDY71312.1 chemotaxis protein CheA [Nitrospirota bacterium]